MGERVETGGLMSFDYGRKKNPKLGDKKEKEINDAYEKYYERKKREKRNKIIIWMVIVLALILGVWFLFLR